MTALFLPQAFKAVDGVVLFEGRPVSPAKRSEVKHALTTMGRATEHVPTLRALDGLQMQLIAAGVAAVNQARAAIRQSNTTPTPERAA